MQARSQSVRTGTQALPSRDFLLGDQDADSGAVVRRKFRRDGKSSSPYQRSGACQDGPAFAFPGADALLIQQAFQLMRVAMARRPQPVAGTPVSQNEWETKSMPVQDRPRGTSFSPLGGPVNHSQAEDAS